MRCDEAARHLPKVIDGAVPPAVAAHVDGCLRCQVESVRYRRVARTLRQLQAQVADPTPDLVPEILSWIDEAQASGAARSARYRRAAYVAAAATAATAAGAAGALVIAARSRRGRLGLAG